MFSIQKILLLKNSKTIWYLVTTIRVFKYYLEIKNGLNTEYTLYYSVSTIRIPNNSIIRSNSLLLNIGLIFRATFLPFYFILSKYTGCPEKRIWKMSKSCLFISIKRYGDGVSMLFWKILKSLFGRENISDFFVKIRKFGQVFFEAMIF